jgi:hypothetical protein
MKEKVIELNDIIDNLIGIAHEEYFKHTDTTEQARLDGKIKAYWEVKDYVENILVVE